MTQDINTLTEDQLTDLLYAVAGKAAEAGIITALTFDIIGENIQQYIDDGADERAAIKKELERSNALAMAKRQAY